MLGLGDSRRPSWASGRKFCFCLFAISFWASISLHAEPTILKCSADLKKIARQFDQEVIRGELKRADQLLDELRKHHSEDFDKSRFESLRKSYPLFILFSSDADSLRKLAESMYQEEFKLLMRLNRHFRATDQEEALRLLQDFNRSAYFAFSDIQAEAVYSGIIQLQNQNPRLKQLVLRQYELFRSAFRIKGEDNLEDDFPSARLLDAQMNRRKSDLLYADLHSLDMTVSVRARYFLHKVDTALRMLAATRQLVSTGYLEVFQSAWIELSTGRFERNLYRDAPSEYRSEVQAQLLFVADALQDKQRAARSGSPQTKEAIQIIKAADPYFLLEAIPTGHPYEGINLLQLILIQKNPDAVNAAIYCFSKNYGWFITALEDKLDSQIK